jgi:hypothetical protein
VAFITWRCAGLATATEISRITKVALATEPVQAGGYRRIAIASALIKFVN